MGYTAEIVRRQQIENYYKLRDLTQKMLPPFAEALASEIRRLYPSAFPNKEHDHG